jgi:choline dehydrogenase-like flavoprotein
MGTCRNPIKADVVVIGSGAGGGTVAKTLAPLCARGCKVLLLEAGGRFGSTDQTRRELEMAGKYYVDQGGFQTVSKDMTLAFAQALGGSTAVYTGTSLEAPPQTISSWGIWGLTHEDLKPRYQRYKTENNVHLLPRDQLNDNNRLFEAGCRALGWRVEQFPVNVKNCQGLGTCNLGCAAGAKQGTAAVQIPRAEQQGVEVVTWCTVYRLEDHRVYATIRPPVWGLERSSWDTGEYLIEAEVIVVCGGAVESPALLMRSNITSHSSPALGKYFTCHPALILAGKHPEPIQNIEGHPKSFYCDHFESSHHFILESCMYFPFTLAKNVSGFGEEMDIVMRSFPHLQMILVLAIDPAEAHNRISLGKDAKTQVRYRFHPRTLNSLVEACRASAKIFFAAGADWVYSPGMDSMRIHRKDADEVDRMIRKSAFRLGQVSISAAHLMGGCRMGEDPMFSVTDGWGKIHGSNHVYVADASLFPQALGINPYLTIMALADRVAEGIQIDQGWNA